MINRRDLIVVENCKNANPNGDLSADNQPRMDFETSKGLISPVSIKRRIRDAVRKLHGEEAGYAILMYNDGTSLEAKAKEILDGLNLKDVKAMDAKQRDRMIKKAVCDKYWDVRTFGAAITNFNKLGVSDGQITGPVQIGWGESIDPIIVDDPQYITRSVAATDKDLSVNKTVDIGTKYITNAQYAYEVHVCDNDQTGISEKDYEYLLEGIQRRWDLNRTSSKTGMEVECVIEFIHDSRYGSASMAMLRKAIVRTVDDENAVRKHYSFTVDESKLPKGVKAIVH